MRRLARLLALSLLLAPALHAQQFDFDGDVKALAARLIAGYHDDDRERYLDNLFRLQLAAAKYGDALQTLAALRAPYTMQYEIFARAKIEGGAFEETFPRLFREFSGTLPDRLSASLMRSMTATAPPVPDIKGPRLELRDALRLVRGYQIAETYRAIGPLAAALVEEDDKRRYAIETNVPVKMPDGATVCAVIVRPRAASGKLPALLQFTIYADVASTMTEARRAAASGYVSVTGFTRGKLCSPDTPVPYEHDGADAAALIDWITQQPWSDGRVGMYGGSYSGFTVWAAAKHRPKGLKTIVDGAPVAPGIDVPMEGNINWTFVYPWTFYTLDDKTLDDATYYQNDRWFKMRREWYVSGRPYRELEKIDGTPNPIFGRWLAHPSYDAYWRSMIPYGAEFARVDIPVLQTAGYYFGGPGAAVYYFEEHTRHRPNAEHYLVIGPYDHPQGQRGNALATGGYGDERIAGYVTDPAARMDLQALRFAWFDYVLKGAAKPSILQDKINYEVTDGNVWKHAPSIAKMADRRIRFHLTALRQLRRTRPATHGTIAQSVNLADRSDADVFTPGGGVLDKDLDTDNGVAFVSEPFKDSVELSGLFSGHLDFTTNKKDFDFQIALFEKKPSGEYMQLAPYWSRASYVRDRAQRHLLTPGKREQLDFTAMRLMSCRLQPGSRLVVVLTVIKEAGRQINCGTGKDVNDESIADAKVPLEIRWSDASWIEVPVRY